MTQRTLAERLDEIAAQATAITMGTDTTSDASALHTAANALWKEIADKPAENLPMLTALAKKLTPLLETAPPTAKAERARYEDAAAAAKFDWIEPPRAVTAFVFLDALERIRTFCASK